MLGLAPDKTNKVLFILANSLLAYVWLRFFVYLTARWHASAPHIRDEVSLFMTCFTFLWLAMLSEGKRSKYAAAPILLAGIVFLSVVQIVKIVM